MIKVLSGVVKGYEAFVLADIARQKGFAVHIANSDFDMRAIKEALDFLALDIQVLEFPAWDILPYDRVSPSMDIMAKRLDTLRKLKNFSNDNKKPIIVLTTVAAIMAKVVPFSYFDALNFVVNKGEEIDSALLVNYLIENGYNRVDQVMEQGEFALRGGIIDVFPLAAEYPLRLDFFGDTLEEIRVFDVISQTAIGNADNLVLQAAGEVVLNPSAIALFRTNYRKVFGSMIAGDELYESISVARLFLGMENWLAFFYSELVAFFDYIGKAVIVMDFEFEIAIKARVQQVEDFYNAREEALQIAKKTKDSSFCYRPVPIPLMFWNEKEFYALLDKFESYSFSPFVASDGIDLHSRVVPVFTERQAGLNEDVFKKVYDYLKTQMEMGKRALILAYSSGSKTRLLQMFAKSGIYLGQVDTWEEFNRQTKTKANRKNKAYIMVLELENGFVSDDLVILSEQDILGQRLAFKPKKSSKTKDFIQDISSILVGDLVVHTEHGIGRYQGLVVVTVGGAAHDCLLVVYAKGDKLYVPVENIEVLSRFGSEQAGVNLDNLGSANWQARKAKLKSHLLEMAKKLTQIAAMRYLTKGEPLVVPKSDYDKFILGFPYVETEDQQRTIEEVFSDLTSGRVMDRLVCGDVGFGKTEVAIRAAFITAMAGKQVMVIAPTTILAQQHSLLFEERFKGWPIRIGRLSRLVKSVDAKKVKKELADGSLDIVIGTHALLAKDVDFARLGLVVVDEEQHFGVAMKERLKELSGGVNLLTLSATPIPRTLQLALSGVRDLSVIATPPIDRLAVRTFVMPSDELVIKEAILREVFRGGQVFYVCPRVSDIPKVLDFLHKIVPDVRAVFANGQMSSIELENRVSEFMARKYDVLVATSIIESGIDMPTVNTIIIHRADMFGLASLYQLRGRVGRAKVRAYAYLTVPNDKTKMTAGALKRLMIMQKLDGLAEGFNLASYDLDIRGAGNLLGEEQSGHIKEVGIELYQQMLEEAIAEFKTGNLDEENAALSLRWEVVVNLGIPVLIPDTYVADLNVRLSLYRRLAELSKVQDIDAVAAEIEDRFGSIPEELNNLFKIVAIKILCYHANISKIDAGEKGAVITLKDGKFPAPLALVNFIAGQAGTMKVKEDGKIVYLRNWKKQEDKVKGVRFLVEQLVEVAKDKE